MKNYFYKGLILMVALCCMLGGALADATQVNEKYDADSMVSVTGKTVEITDPGATVGDQTFGFLFIQPAAWGELKNNDLGTLDMMDSYACVGYLPEAYKDIPEKMRVTAADDEWEKLYNEMGSKSLKVLCVFRVNPDEAQTVEDEAAFRNDYAAVEEIAKNGNDTWYVAYNEKFDDPALSENDVADIAKLAEGRAEIVDTLMLFPAEEIDWSEYEDYEEPELIYDLASFTAKDLNGNEFTQAEFAKYDLTMINIWATYCGPCLDEMDDLVKLKTMLPGNVNMITICSDAADNMDLAKQLLASVDADFTTLVDNDELREKLLNNVLGVPTTIFVDKDGKAVGAHIVGAPYSDAASDDIAEGYLQLINERLAK